MAQEADLQDEEEEHGIPAELVLREERKKRKVASYRILSEVDLQLQTGTRQHVEDRGQNRPIKSRLVSLLFSESLSGLRQSTGPCG